MARRASANDRARIALPGGIRYFYAQEWKGGGGNGEGGKYATLLIPDNRYLVFIELVTRIRVSCGARARARAFPPSPESHRFFYGHLAVYLFGNSYCTASCMRCNVERYPFRVTARDERPKNSPAARSFHRREILCEVSLSGDIAIHVPVDAIPSEVKQSEGPAKCNRGSKKIITQ